MKKILYSMILVISCFFATYSYAATNNLTVSVQYFDTNGTLNPASTPSKVPTTGISGLQITVSGPLSANFVVNDSSTSPSAANWGIYFASSTTPTTPANNLSCSTNGASSCENLTSADITVLSTSTVPAYTGSATPFSYTSGGSVNLILTIKNFPNNNLPGDMQGLFSGNSVAVGFLYAAPSVAATNNVADYGLWQTGVGTLVNGPILQTHFNSVKALQTQFKIININPPTSTAAACPAPAGSTSYTTCKADGDGSSAGGGGGAVGGLLQPVASNSVSGYVVGFWNETTCSANPGNFVFDQNWMAYNYAQGYSKYVCNYATIAYSQNTAQNVGGDTNSPDLGCNAITPLPVFYTPYNASFPVLTPNSGAIPYTGRTGNPKSDLAEIIGNATKPTQGPDSCISYVYLIPSQTFTSPTIDQNSIYGVVVWALNSASNYDNSSVPNYSLNHSNVVYTTTSNFILASSSKDSSLGLSTDCFVVTAASGNPNSPSVFYWRLLRDEYLTPIGFTKFYYNHARVWAHWLDQHPSLKPPLNYIFEKSGYGFYRFGKFAQEVNHKAKINFHKFINKVSSLFDNTANAQERLAFETAPQDNQNIKSDFGFDQDNTQQNIDVFPGDMNNDPFFTPARKKSNLQPMYDFAIKGGVLLPTQDKDFYDTFYSTQPSMYGELSLSRLMWYKNLGFSMGLQGRYLTNSQDDTATTLGAQEGYSRTFYAITGEALIGVRYRNPSFTYLQPGLFAGGGLTRFRETASASGTTSDGSQGVTEYSPIYEAGATLDLSLSAIAGQTQLDVGDTLNEVLFRVSASYNNNPSKALSSTGYFVGAGFAFLIN